MTKSDKVATSHYCILLFSLMSLLRLFQILGGGGALVFFVPLPEQFAENANKSYHVYKVIVRLHIYY